MSLGRQTLLVDGIVRGCVGGELKDALSRQNQVVVDLSQRSLLLSELFLSS